MSGEFGAAVPNGGERKFTAFISYKHADNSEEGRRWAAWLHEQIEAYRVPRDLIEKEKKRGRDLPRLLYPVFRDEWEMRAGGNLGELIEDGLQRSDCLLVLCTPRSAQSPWVWREVDRFIELNKRDRIIPVLVAGQPNSTAAATAEEAVRECLPPQLRAAGAMAADTAGDEDTGAWLKGLTDRLAADLRPEKRPGEGYSNAAMYRRALEQGEASLPSASRKSRRELRTLEERYARQLRDEFLKIVAGMLNLDHGELMRRDAEARARWLRRMLLLSVAIGLLIAAAGIWAMVESNRRQTLLQEASLREHAAAVASLDAVNWPVAVAHLDRALTYWPENADSASLLWSMLRYGFVAEALVPRWQLAPPGRFDMPQWSRDSRYLLLRHDSGEWAVHDAATGALVRQEKIPLTTGGSALFRLKAPQMLAPLKKDRVGLFTLPTLAAGPTFAFSESPLDPWQMSPDGRWLICREADGHLRLVDLTASAEAPPFFLEDKAWNELLRFTWRPDSQALAIAGVEVQAFGEEETRRIRVRIYDPLTGKRQREFAIEKPNFGWVHYDGSGRYLLFDEVAGIEADDPASEGEKPAGTDQTGYQVWQIEPEPKNVKESGGGARASWFSSDGWLLESERNLIPVRRQASSDTLFYARSMTDEGASGFRDLPVDHYASYEVSLESGVAVFLTEEGQIVRCDASPPRRRSQVKWKDYGKDAILPSPDGRWLACTDDNLLVWSGPPAFSPAEPAVPPRAIKPPAPLPATLLSWHQQQDKEVFLKRKVSGRVCGQFAEFLDPNDPRPRVPVEDWVDGSREDFRAFEYPWTPPAKGDMQMQRFACVLAGMQYAANGEVQSFELEKRCKLWEEAKTWTLNDPAWKEALEWWLAGRPLAEAKGFKNTAAPAKAVKATQ